MSVTSQRLVEDAVTEKEVSGSVEEEFFWRDGCWRTVESGGWRASLGIGGLKRDGRGGLRHGRGEGGHRGCSRISERLGALVTWVLWLR